MARLRRARVSAVAYFAVLGVADGVWLARIPAFKHGLNLSDGVLGVALLAAPAGTVLAAVAAGRLVDRFGSARPITLAGAAVALLPIALGLAGSLAALMVALFAFGAVAGLLDVAMNAQAVRVERAYRRPLISSFHACYSLGGLSGALLGGLFASAGVGPAPTFAAVGGPLAMLAVIASRGLLRGPECRGASDANAADRAPAGQSGAGQSGAGQSGASQGGASQGGASQGAVDRSAAGPGAADRTVAPAEARGAGARIIILGLLALCCLLGEGAAGSWSAVYLHDNLGTSAGFAALGYAAFSVMMAVGRLFGDRLVTRFGPARLVSACGLVAAVGLAAGLISGQPAGVLIGFAVFGAGLSCTFPQLLSAAGNTATPRSGRGIARVAGTGYLGLLAGPVVIGGCASLVGLRLAFGLPVILMLVVALGGAAARPQPPS
jgi:MFS family permease